MIRSQAPKTATSKVIQVMEKVQRLDEIGSEGIRNSQ